MKKRILTTVKTHLLLNEDVLTADEIKDLREQIRHLENEIATENRRKRLEELRVFKGHLLDRFEEAFPSDEENYDQSKADAFNDAEFTISFMGKSVSIWNGADSFGTIEELIDYEISEYEEV